MMMVVVVMVSRFVVQAGLAALLPSCLSPDKILTVLFLTSRVNK